MAAGVQSAAGKEAGNRRRSNRGRLQAAGSPEPLLKGDEQSAATKRPETDLPLRGGQGRREPQLAPPGASEDGEGP